MGIAFTFVPFAWILNIARIRQHKYNYIKSSIFKRLQKISKHYKSGQIKITTYCIIITNALKLIHFA